MKVLMTGAAGIIGTRLWPRLASRFQLRLSDLADIPDAVGVECVKADITDPAQMCESMRGVDAVVHLAGNRMTTATWDELVAPNIVGVHTVLTSAVEMGVPQVVLASSLHASGRHDVDRIPHVDPSWTPRPCCPYGVSKVYAETAARHLTETTPLRVVALRIGAFSERPYGPQGQQFWVSPDDTCRAFTAALSSDVRYGVYYAGSVNTRGRWNLEPGERDLGFVPQDDSADYDDVGDFPGVPCYAGSV